MKYLITYSNQRQWSQAVIDLDIDLDKEYSKLDDDVSIFIFTRNFFEKYHTKFNEDINDMFRLLVWKCLGE